MKYNIIFANNIITIIYNDSITIQNRECRFFSVILIVLAVYFPVAVTAKADDTGFRCILCFAVFYVPA